MESIDRIGWVILRELQQDARLSFSELGRRVGMSPPAVAERVRRMEEAGIITGYRALVNPYKVGAAMLVLIRMTAFPTQYSRLLDRIRQTDEVLECHRVTGSDCVWMKAAVSSVDHLERLIHALLPYGEINSSVILSSPVTDRILTHPVGMGGDASEHPSP